MKGIYLRAYRLAAIVPCLTWATETSVPPALRTRWAAQVDPESPWPEYPRPTMVRPEWQSLNGRWELNITPTNTGMPSEWPWRILVPYPIESALSGMGRRVSPAERIWYRRAFVVPDAWRDRRLLLHFGAVDWEAVVYVNDREVGRHRGGYDAFSFDITDALLPGPTQTLVVAVWDPTNEGYQPHGKQHLRPHGIWYTPVSGIWQTPWIEPVQRTSICSLQITPSVPERSITVEADLVCHGPPSMDAGPLELAVEVYDLGQCVARARGPADAPLRVRIPAAKLWSPESPHLYDVTLSLWSGTQIVDRVASYAGLRSIDIQRDSTGALRLYLNGRPLFLFGPLDQGWWPDGLYTAPTDEALRFDIEATRAYGMNAIRKHVKVEPERWYWWCDRLGVLVLQDMPNAKAGDGSTDQRRSDEAAAQFERELRAMIGQRFNHPSIVMWIPFNEGWGQHETTRYVELIRRLDPTRLVNEASGWYNRGSGDIRDLHHYPEPVALRELDPHRAVIIGEFGGLGLPLEGHLWQPDRNWGYRTYRDTNHLTEALLDLLDRLHPLTGTPGIGAAIYTQTTDVEIEVNGLMTYDRAVFKILPERVAPHVRRLYTPPEPRRHSTDRLTPPAFPLIVHDPYFSIWSPADHPASAPTEHWTGRPHRLTALVRLEGRTWRLLGSGPRTIPPMKLVSFDVLPTRTMYHFEEDRVRVSLVFMTPALPDDLDVLARPVTYVSCSVRSRDGRPRPAQLYFDVAPEIAVHEPSQQVEWSVPSIEGLVALRVGTVDQPILQRRGDDVRIDWGYLYVAAPRAAGVWSALGDPLEMRAMFADTGRLPSNAPLNAASAPATEAPWGAFAMELGTVGREGADRWLMIAYDDLWSIRYMNTDLRPYWRRHGQEAADLLTAAAHDFHALSARCEQFDAELMVDLERVGGRPYARLAALAYRQCFGAGKFVADAHGQPIQFSKENHSNGCISTADVFYPMSPQFLLFGSSLARSFLVPFMNYAASERWKFRFAPHDLGTYPHANGQRYGGGETSELKQMPVEESGNLLLLMAAVAKLEGDAAFAARWRPQLDRWADYLREKGFDPDHQLCTDDFAGPLAHNANLSLKAICALGAYAQLCEAWGDPHRAREFRDLARRFAADWMRAASDGDHFRLAFDQPGTWSQKYNLVWDRLLGLGLFSPDVGRTEMAYYRRIQNRYGLPLDNRASYTKLDWTVWTATLTGRSCDFESLVMPVLRFLNETPDRSPMTDWYCTLTARKRGFTARPVVGAVFLPVLYHEAIWRKWSARDRTRADHYAPLPPPPVVRELMPTSEDLPQRWRYTFVSPPPTWTQPDFDDSGWTEGEGGFGTHGTPGAVVRTVWSTGQIWLRRRIECPELRGGRLWLRLHHDEDVEVYLNGCRVVRRSGFLTSYELVPLSPEVVRSLDAGPLTIAVSCRQTGGGQYIDLGLLYEERR